MAHVSLHNLTKTFFDRQTKQQVAAVNGLNLDIADGEFLVLVGPSGCGKTTALRIIAGLEEATAGDVRIGDRVVNDEASRDRNIALVFQNYALYPHMTVYQNLSFGLRLRLMPNLLRQITQRAETRRIRAEIHQRVLETAGLLEIEPLLDRLPKALSGGQRQRVALGRAIVRQPQVFLMDEPLSNLDAKLRVQTRAELIKLHRRLGITTIYVTHDQAEAMTMGQRIAVMKDGVLQQCDAPLKLYHEPVNMFVAGFLGTPAMNFVPVQVLADRTLDAGAFQVRLPPHRAAALAAYAGRPAVLGIRPEDIHDATAASEINRDNVVQAKVDVIEPMGAVSILYLTAGAHTLLASVGATTAREGAILDVVIDAETALVFDKDSELRIV